MKKINAKIYSDEDFPGKFFIRHDNGRMEVANVVTPKRTAQRGGYAFFWRDADKKSRNISEQRVQRAIDEHKPLLQVRYVSKAESRSIRENTLMKRLLCLRRSLMAEYPGSHVDMFFDEAVTHILARKKLPETTAELKLALFRTMAALKHHRERTTVPFYKVEFKISDNN